MKRSIVKPISLLVLIFLMLGLYQNCGRHSGSDGDSSDHYETKGVIPVPAAPQNLTISLNGAGPWTVDFDWDPPSNASASGVTHYEYRRFATGGGTMPAWRMTTDTGATFNITDPPGFPGAVVTYYVRAVGPEGTGPITTIEHTNPNQGGGSPAPAAPQNLSISLSGSGPWTVNFDWDPPSNASVAGVTHYEYRRFATGGSTMPAWRRANGTSATFNITDPPGFPGAVVTYYVRAVGPGGTSLATIEHVNPGQIDSSLTPEASQNLGVSFNGTGPWTVDFDWDPPSNASVAGVTHYEYRRFATGGDTMTSWKTTTDSSATFNITDPPGFPGALITYHVRAVGPGGTGPVATITRANPGEDTPAPAAPQNLSVSFSGEGPWTVNFDWDPSSNASASGVTHYEYRRFATGGDTMTSWKTTASASETSGTFNIANPPGYPSALITYHVRAVRRDGVRGPVATTKKVNPPVGIYSNPMVPVALTALFLTAPQNLDVSFSGTGPWTVNFDWDPSASKSGLTHYEYRRFPTGGDTMTSWKATANASETSATFNITDPPGFPGALITYHVRAVRRDGTTGLVSTITRANPGGDTPIPTAPQNLSVNFSGTGPWTVNFDWDPSSNASASGVTHYEYRRFPTGGDTMTSWKTTASASETSGTFNIANPPGYPGVLITYHVRAVRRDGVRSPVAIITRVNPSP